MPLANPIFLALFRTLVTAMFTIYTTLQLDPPAPSRPLHSSTPSTPLHPVHSATYAPLCIPFPPLYPTAPLCTSLHLSAPLCTLHCSLYPALLSAPCTPLQPPLLYTLCNPVHCLDPEPAAHPHPLACFKKSKGKFMEILAMFISRSLCSQRHHKDKLKVISVLFQMENIQLYFTRENSIF